MTFLKRALVGAALAVAVSSFVPAIASAQPPAPTIGSSPANPSNTASPSFTYSSSYTQVSFQCQLDGGGYTACPGYAYGGATSGTESYSGLADGSHTFDVRALDFFGNAGPAASYGWTIDLVAPALSLPANITVQSPLGRSMSVSYSVTATDNRDSSPSISCDHGRTGGVFPLGATTIHCTATDAAGNSASGSFTVSIVDTTPPKAPSFSARPVNPSADPAPSFGVQTNEPATFKCRLDAAAFATCSATTSYAGLGDGSHTFAVYAIDSSGNASTTTSYTWTVDTTAPLLSLPAPITVEAPSGGSAIVSYSASATDAHDPNPQLNCTYPSASGFPLGTTSVICTATDWVGNSTIASFTVTVQDTTPPDAPSLYGPPDPSSDNPDLYYYTNDWNATWECSLDGAPFANCPLNHVGLQALSDGTHTFAVRAVDASGNVSTTTSDTWVVDTVAPILTLPADVTVESPLGAGVHVPYLVTATDNYDQNPSVFCDYGKAGGWFPLGTTTVDCTAYDAAGNTSSGSFTVAVEDTVPPDTPSVWGPSRVTNNSASSLYYSTNERDVSWECALDGAPLAPCSANGTSYTGLLDGTHTFEVGATDSSGNIGATTAYVWTIDTVPPVMIVPANITAEAPLGDGVNVPFTVSASDDRDSNPNVWCDQSSRSGRWFPVGTTTVTCTAYDDAGNAAQASFTVTVEDNVPPKAPTIWGPSDLTNSSDAALYYSTNEWDVSWECALDGAALAPCPAFNTYYSGLADGKHTFEVRATDSSGNIGGTTTYTWTIDTVPPVLSVPSNLVAESPNTSGIYVDYTVSAYDTRDPNPVIGCDHANWFWVGTTTVTCDAYDDAGNVSHASFTVTVVDPAPPDAPNVWGPADPTNSSSAGFYYSTNEGDVTWECSLDGSSFAECGSGYTDYAGLGDGVHTFEVFAVDADGNAGAATAYTWTVDTVPPVLTVPTDITVESPLGLGVQVPYAILASDENDPNPLVYCNYGLRGGWFSVGTTTVNCSSYDEAGNSSQASFTVTVEDTQPPDAPSVWGPSDTTDSSAATFYYSTNEWDVSWECSLDGGTLLTCPANGTSYTGLGDGTHTLDVRAIDSSGNVSAFTTYTWMIDTVPPAITVPANITAASPLGNYVNVPYAVTASDDRDPSPDVWCDHGRDGDWFPVGTTTVTCTAYDDAGNSAQASFTVTVEDTVPPEAPMVWGPFDLTNSSASSLYYSTNEWDVTWECALDGAPLAPCSANGTNYTGLPDGKHTFEVGATDSSGNVGASTTYTWTIDTVPPVLTVPADITTEAQLGSSTHVAYTASASDARDPSPYVGCSPSGRTGGWFPVGTTTVTCNASDAAGNSSQASFTVTVEDTQPPDPPMIWGPPLLTSDTSASFWYSTNDWTATWECSLDGAAFAPCGSGPASYDGLGDGVHTFTARATDPSGNSSESTYTWTVDLTPPQLTTPGPLTVESPDGGATDVSYLVSAADDNDPNPAVWCDRGGTGGGRFPLGSTIVTCTASDAAGNSSVATFTVTVQDTTPPDVTIDAQPSDPSGLSSAEFDVSSDEANASLECSLDGAPSGPCSSSVTYTGLADGTHTFSVYAVDASGNVGPAATTSWLVDLGAPVLSTPGPLSVESPLGADASISYAVAAADGHDPNPDVVCNQGTRSGGTFPLGTTTVTCTATDWAGNSSAASFTVTVSDTTPPVAPGLSGPGDPSKDPAPTLAYATNEHNANFQCSLDGAPFAACSGTADAQGTHGEYTAPGLADGSHSFQVLVVDSSGNIGPAATYSWTVDLNPPVLTVPAVPTVESPLGADAAVSYTVSAVDAHDPSPAISCDRGNATGGTFPLGTTIVTCTTSDAAGNVSSPQSFTVTVLDRTPPDAPSLTSKPADPSRFDSASFNLGTNEPATFECSLDGGVYGPCGSSVTYNGLVDGTHTFAARATDLSGNLGQSTSYSWAVDLTAPMLTAPGPTSAESPLGGVVHVAYTVSATDNHDPSPSIACDHGDANGGDFGLGTTTVMCTATDAAGNASAPESFTVTVVDTTPPVAPNVSGPADPSNDASPTFSYTTDEQNATFECSLDGALLAACGPSASYSGLADGPHTFEVRAIDSSGNVGAIATYGWTIDTVAPTTTISAGPTDPTADPNPSFSFSASEAVSFECELDGGGFAHCASPAGFTGLAPGAHTLEVRATDLAGNLGAVVSYSWTQN